MFNQLPTELTDRIFYTIVQNSIEETMNKPFCEQGSRPEFEWDLYNILITFPEPLLRQPAIPKLKLYRYLHQHQDTNMFFMLTNSITASILQMKDQQTLHVKITNKPTKSSIPPFNISPIKTEEFLTMIQEFVKPKKNICTLIIKADFNLEALPLDGKYIWRRDLGIAPSRRLRRSYRSN